MPDAAVKFFMNLSSFSFSNSKLWSSVTLNTSETLVKDVAFLENPTNALVALADGEFSIRYRRPEMLVNPS